MKTIPTALSTKYAAGVCAVAMLWKVERKDGLTYGFTDHDTDIVYSGLTYEAATGYAASAIRSSAALDVDDLEIEGLLSSSRITETDLLAGKWDGAKITVMRISWESPSDGVEVLRTGTLGEVSLAGAVFRAELRGKMQALQSTVGRVFSPLCDAMLGDTRCGVNLTPYTFSHVVAGVTSRGVFADTVTTKPSGYYNNGIVTFTSGQNSGLSMEVRSYDGTTFSLQHEMPFAVTVGDTFSAVIGCDKTFSTCQATFNNVINFRGFPHVPGQDRLISGK